MKSSNKFPRIGSLIASALLGLGICLQPASAQYVNKYRIEKSYEDTVRIVVLTNETATGNGYCPTGTKPVGPLTRDFIKNSIATVPNVRYFAARTTTWDMITQIQWPGKPLGTLPHAIVHVNAGWTSESGNLVYPILDRAADLKIGVVSIGDDAAAFATQVFGFINTNNVPQPMGDARQLRGNNALWIALDTKDTLPAPGVTRNTADSLKKKILQFKPYPGDNVTAAGNYRCQEDADAYQVSAAFQNRLTFLGYQRGFNGTDTVKTGADLTGKVGPLQTVVAFQDSLRRGVALSYQPEFLLDSVAAHQIDYDAIIYASFAHLFHLKVGPVVANPVSGTTFRTQLPVFLTTDPSDAIIYYTTNGSTPDSNSTRYDKNTGINLISSTTIKAIAYKLGFEHSEVSTFTYTKNFTASTIEIRDKDGNPLRNGYLTENYSAYTVVVTTYQGGLGNQIQAKATTQGGDKETLTLPYFSTDVEALIFKAVVPFSTPAAAASGDGKTQASVYDSLTVTWVNPKDSLGDRHSVTVPVRPEPKQGKIYFSTKPDGSDNVDQYAGTESKIYVVVVDEVLPSGKPPKVTVSTKPFANGGTPDLETFTTPLGGTPAGTYVFAIDTGSGAGKLGVSLNDQITATYKDPLDGDSAVANAGFGTAPLITANLQFTDASGNAVPDGAKYSPANNLLYLQLTDDWAGGFTSGKLDSLPVALSITNYEGKATADAETVWVHLQPAHQGSTGIWKGTIDLKDYRNIVPLNKIAETYVLGDITATVMPHDNAGNPEGTPVKDRLLVAYPDQNPAITIDGPGGDPVVRADTGIQISVVDQSISSGRDTLYVDLSCGLSGDKVSHVMLIEDLANPGHYISKIIGKTEGTPNGSDSILTCASQDHIKVTYIDPVYKTETPKTVDINEPVASQLYFSSDPGGAIKIGTVSEGDTNSFYAVLLARDPDITKPDTFMVTMKIPGGDIETFVAKETGNHTNKFVVQVPFGFVTGVVTTNGKLEGKLSSQNFQNRVNAVGTVVVDHEETSAAIVLIAEFDQITKAYIKDVNGDGQADHVYMVFAKSLPRLPGTVDARWDSTNSPINATTAFSFLDDEHTIVVADYSTHPFPPGQTSIADGQIPTVALPDDPLFAAQKKNIEDSIGPVLTKAFKRPAGAGTTIDTLLIVVSEPIQSSGDLKKMLKFSISCDKHGDGRYIEAYTTPVPDANDPTGTHYTILVDNKVTWVESQSCVYLDDTGPITDLKLNPAIQPGIKLLGGDQISAIRGLRGYPSVAGLDPASAPYQAATNDPYDTTSGSGFANADKVVNWIPPVEWESQSGTVASTGKYQQAVPVAGHTYPPDNTFPQEIPKYISTVQVISTLAYTAKVGIFDHYGNFVRSFTQYFGDQNEMSNPRRSIPGKGWVSYLVWDMHDSKGQMAGQGVYIWKIVFEFKKRQPDGTFVASSQKQEIRYVRTGLMRLK